MANEWERPEPPPFIDLDTWPSVWVCPVCGRYEEEPGKCTACAYYGSPKRQEFKLPPQIWTGYRCMAQINWLFNLAAPFECGVDVVVHMLNKYEPGQVEGTIREFSPDTELYSWENKNLVWEGDRNA